MDNGQGTREQENDSKNNGTIDNGTMDNGQGTREQENKSKNNGTMGQ